MTHSSIITLSSDAEIYPGEQVADVKKVVELSDQVGLFSAVRALKY